MDSGSDPDTDVQVPVRAPVDLDPRLDRRGERPRPRSPLRDLAVGTLGLAAAAGYLASGLPLALGLLVSPSPGNGIHAIALQALDALGWLAIGLWLIADWLHLRLRVLVPPLAAWLWTYLLLSAVAPLGCLYCSY